MRWAQVNHFLDASGIAGGVAGWRVRRGLAGVTDFVSLTFAVGAVFTADFSTFGSGFVAAGLGSAATFAVVVLTVLGFTALVGAVGILFAVDVFAAGFVFFGVAALRATGFGFAAALRGAVLALAGSDSARWLTKLEEVL